MKESVYFSYSSYLLPPSLFQWFTASLLLLKNLYVIYSTLSTKAPRKHLMIKGKFR